ncbi:hypothetical protein ABH917_002913 [Thermobifida halotolerans]
MFGSAVGAGILWRPRGGVRYSASAVRGGPHGLAVPGRGAPGAESGRAPRADQPEEHRSPRAGTPGVRGRCGRRGWVGPCPDSAPGAPRPATGSRWCPASEGFCGMPRPRRGAAEPHPPRTRHSNLGQSDHVRSAPMEELRERLAGPSHRCPAVILSRDHFSPAEIAPGTKGRTPAEASPTIQNSITVSVNRRTDSAFPAARKPRISFPPDAEIADTLPENATGGHLNRENRKSRSRPWAPQQHAIPTGRKKWLSRVSAERRTQVALLGPWRDSAVDRHSAGHRAVGSATIPPATTTLRKRWPIEHCAVPSGREGPAKEHSSATAAGSRSPYTG